MSLENQTLEYIQTALEQHPNTLMTTAFNLNGIVLLDLATRVGFVGQVVFVDTGYHFLETLIVKNHLHQKYQQVQWVTLNANRPIDNLWQTSTDACCTRNKVSPLKNFLEQQKPSALLNARSREQNSLRANIELREEKAERIHFNPLAFWTRAELERYAQEHQLELHPLYAQGYLSIGCAPCTRAVENNEEARAGRWSGSEKTECGLWNRGGI
jgi:phosphoadenosine phosphosulfate reductase